MDEEIRNSMINDDDDFDIDFSSGEEVSDEEYEDIWNEGEEEEEVDEGQPLDDIEEDYEEEKEKEKKKKKEKEKKKGRGEEVSQEVQYSPSDSHISSFEPKVEDADSGTIRNEDNYASKDDSLKDEELASNVHTYGVNDVHTVEEKFDEVFGESDSSDSQSTNTTSKNINDGSIKENEMPQVSEPVNVSTIVDNTFEYTSPDAPNLFTGFSASLMSQMMNEMSREGQDFANKIGEVESLDGFIKYNQVAPNATDSPSGPGDNPSPTPSEGVNVEGIHKDSSFEDLRAHASSDGFNVDDGILRSEAQEKRFNETHDVTINQSVASDEVRKRMEERNLEIHGDKPTLVDGMKFNEIFKENFKDAQNVIFSSDVAPTAEAKLIDVSNGQKGGIYAWQEGDSVYVSTLQSDSKVVSHINAMGMFEGLSIKSIDFKGLDTSKTEIMANYLADCKNLEKATTQHLDTSNAKDVSGMFLNNEKLKELQVSHFQLQKTNDLTAMFKGCKNLEHIDVKSWNTSKVISTESMFSGCEKLKHINISDWDTSSLVYVSNMFRDCKNIKTIELDGINTSNVKKIDGFVSGCVNLEKMAIAKIKANSLINADGMFYNTPKLDETSKILWYQKNKNTIEENVQNVISTKKPKKDDIDKELEKIFTKEKNVPGQLTPFDRPKEDAIDKMIIRDSALYKMLSSEHQRRVQQVQSAARGVVHQVVQTLDNAVLDEDQKKALDDTKKIIDGGKETIKIAGLMIGIVGISNHIGADVATMNRTNRELLGLISKKTLSVDDLLKSKKDLIKHLNDANLPKNQIARIVKYRKDAYNLFVVRENILAKSKAGMVKLSDATKIGIQDTLFTEIGGRTNLEMVNALLNSSKSKVVKSAINLKNKDINAIIKKAKELGLSKEDVSALQLKKVINNKLQSTRKFHFNKLKGKVLVNTITLGRALMHSADATFQEGIQTIVKTKMVLSPLFSFGGFFYKKTVKPTAKFMAKYTIKPMAKVAVRGVKAGGKAIANTSTAKAIANSKVGKKVQAGSKKLGSALEKRRERREEKKVKKISKKVQSEKRKMARRDAMNKASNSALGKAITSPFKAAGKVGEAIGKLGEAIKGLLGKIAIILVIIVLVFFLLIILSSLILSITNTASGVGETTMTSFEQLNPGLTDEEREDITRRDNNILQNHYYAIEGYRDEILERADNIATGVPQNPNVWAGHTIEQYGHPNGDDWVLGSTIHYTNAQGVEVAQTINNEKDVIVMAYIIMGNNFFYDASGREALINALYKYMNPNPTYQESDIYECDNGCEKITYSCNTDEATQLMNDKANGMILKNGTLEYKANGDIYTIVCNGHEFKEVDASGNQIYLANGEESTYTYYHNSHNIKSGVTPTSGTPSLTGNANVTIHFPSGGEATTNALATCNNNTITYICDNESNTSHYENPHPHEITVCYGHKDVDVYIQRYSMEDLFSKDLSSILGSNDNYSQYLNSFEGWTEDNQQWAKDLRDADWMELYGIYIGGGAGVTVGGPVALQMWVYLRSQGFSPEATAAIIGNAYGESSLNPAIESGPAVGLFQFEKGTGNGAGLFAYANSRGEDWTSVTLQIDYMLGQLNSAFINYTGKTYTYSNGVVTWWPVKMSLADFKNYTDVNEATEIFMRVYERPSIPRLNVRQEAARNYYEMYNGYNGSGGDIVQFALQYVGNPYVWGGNSLTDGIDCSHFVWQVLMATGHYSGDYMTSNNWASAGTHVNSISEAQPGDILVWDGHVAIYMGGNQIVHASNSKPYPAGGIKVSTVSDWNTYHDGLIGISRF